MKEWSTSESINIIYHINRKGSKITLIVEKRIFDKIWYSFKSKNSQQVGNNFLNFIKHPQTHAHLRKMFLQDDNETDDK
jgi:hypothetical protein